MLEFQVNLNLKLYGFILFQKTDFSERIELNYTSCFNSISKYFESKKAAFHCSIFFKVEALNNSDATIICN